MSAFISPEHGSKEFRKKPPAIQRLINDALSILERLGVEFQRSTPRRYERTALAFLAVADVKTNRDWARAPDIGSRRALKTRDIIAYVNDNFGEAISMGSYDDVRRQDLLPLVMSGVVLQSKPKSDPNNPTRGYTLDPEAAEAIRKFGNPDWDKVAAAYVEGRPARREAERSFEKMPVELPDGAVALLRQGAHNELQRSIIEEFLPRFGHDASVYYLGDAAKKDLVVKREALARLGFFELGRGKLPDIVAYSHSKNWLFLIEAVTSSGPMSRARIEALSDLLKGCTADLIFVTAFMDRRTMRRFIEELAWETEVWIAEDPDHLIHFNGDKFLGPYGTVGRS